LSAALAAKRTVVDISLGWRHLIGPYKVMGLFV